MLTTTVAILYLLASLMFVHYLIEYPLQGTFLSKAKNRHDPILHVSWWQAMGAHCYMHAFAVWFLTGVPLLALLEGAIHWYVDDKKCQGEFTYNEEQFAHIICKCIWAVVTVLCFDTAYYEYY